MTVNKLDGNRVLIIFGSGELGGIIPEPEALDFDNSRHRGAILELTEKACRKSGIETGGRRINIEALTLGQSCYLLVTVGARRKYRRAEKGDRLCCRLETPDALLELCRQLRLAGVCCEKTSLYLHEGSYCLLFSYPVLPPNAMRLLSEYGRLERGAVRCAGICEQGRLICSRDAFRRLCCAD